MNVPVRVDYFKNLDGLRAIAAFAVIFFHIALFFKLPQNAISPFLYFLFSFGGHGGSLGVTFFFILSGFLITYLMFGEQEKNAKLNIPFFYLRRVLRIWPLYYLTVLIGFMAFPLFSRLAGEIYAETASPWLYALFAVNFDHIYNAMPKSGILAVHWSVAIEEQFYLLWPLVFYFFSKKKSFPYLLFLIVIGSEVFYLLGKSSIISYYHLLSNFRFLAFGALLSWFCYFKSENVTRFLNKINKPLNFIIYVVCISLLLFHQEIIDKFIFLKPLYQCILFLFFGFVIAEQNFSKNSFFKIGSFKFLTWLGKISYGLYLTHMIAIYIVLWIFRNDPRYFLPEIICTIALTILISYLSFNYFESFFLSLKNKFSGVKPAVMDNLAVEPVSNKA